MVALGADLSPSYTCHSPPHPLTLLCYCVLRYCVLHVLCAIRLCDMAAAGKGALAGLRGTDTYAVRTLFHVHTCMYVRGHTHAGTR